MVDSKHMNQHFEDAGAECARQIAFADWILLNKADLVTDAQIKDIQAACAAINPYALYSRCQYGEVPVDQLLTMHAFDPERAAECAQRLGGLKNHTEKFMTVMNVCTA